MSRTPKLGEVWTSLTGFACTCIDEVGDEVGNYGWSWVDEAGKVRKGYFRSNNMTPPKAEPPEWLKATPWVLTGRDSLGGLYASPTDALTPCAWTGWNGALNVLTGEWVPRD